MNGGRLPLPREPGFHPGALPFAPSSCKRLLRSDDEVGELWTCNIAFDIFIRYRQEQHTDIMQRR
jgi:hypothetical protein